MSIGKIGEFNIASGNWSAYQDRIEMYFLANRITDDVKLPTLIALMGEAAYELLATLASPKSTSTLTYKEAVGFLQTHLQPRPSTLAERYRFRQRRQLTDETIANYVAELKKLTRYCEFGGHLEESIRDQFVCGLRSEIIRQRLFAEEDLDYKRAIRLAISLEAAEQNANAVESHKNIISKEADMNLISVNKCFVCGKTNHQASICRYKNYECSVCHKTGHLRRMCSTKRRVNNMAMATGRNGAGVNEPRRSRPRPSVGDAVRRGRAQRADIGSGHSNSGAAYWVREPSGSDDERKQDEDLEEPMYQMSLTKYKPVRMSVLVDNKQLDMEVDTGSSLSCISLMTYDKLFSDLILQPCKLKLTFYDGSAVCPSGYLSVNVQYKNICKKLDLYVINNGSTNLLGRQWLTELDIDIPKCNYSNVKENPIENNMNSIEGIVSRHKSLFDGTLGRYTGGAVSLGVRPGAEAIYCAARPLPYAVCARVDAELDAMLRAGVIEPVDRSDWATPLVIARKADGGIRLCADYKVTLNRVLMVDRYPVPKIDDLFSNMSGYGLFTKLDLSQAYNQLELDEDSRKYTVINTHRGLFKYNRLVYGLASSPGIFQKIMMNLFKNVPDVVVFYDDILIKSKCLDSHLKTVDCVLNILEQNGLKIKKSKCNFLVKQVHYLGFVIDKDGVRVNQNKVKAIADMSPPKNVSELKSFLGMVNFYGKFIRNLSRYLTPLYELLKKGIRWEWNRLHESVFQKVKEKLCSTEVLAHFDMSMRSVVTCDASARGLGAVLAQRAPDGHERVVAYASRALTPAERHYSQIHKEALAIMFAIEKFHQYLYGRNFTLRTDHKPLISIFGSHVGIPSVAASRLQRWAIKLSAYDFDIEYVRTDKNTADALSRLIKQQSLEAATAEEKDTPEQTYLHFAVESLLLDYKTLQKETRSDALLGRILSYIGDGWPTALEIKELRPYYNRRNELYTELGCIMWGHRVVIPSSCRSRVLAELHESHMGMVKTKALARSYVWWPGIDEAVEATCRACEVCAAEADAPPRHAPRSWTWPERPWTRINIDFLGPIHGMTYLIVVDACSKWIEAIRMNNITSQSVITKLWEIFSRFGFPKQLVSDNGPQFISEQFSLFLQKNGIEHIFSAPYHPASNGAAENAVKICKRTIKKASQLKMDIHSMLCNFLLTYRNTVHYATGESPAKILLGRDLRMRLDCLKPDRTARVTQHQAKVEARAGGVIRSLNPQTLVWYRNYRGSEKWLPGKIIEITGNTNYRVEDSNNGTEVHRHIDQLKLRVLPPKDNLVLESSAPRSVIPNKRMRPSVIFPSSPDKNQGSPTAGTSQLDRECLSSPPKIQDKVVTDTVYPGSPNQPTVPTTLPSDAVNRESPEQRRFPLRNRLPVKRYGVDFSYISPV